LAADVPVDRISALLDELRLRILARLTYKDAIRTGALASGWRDLWRSRWTHRASVKVYLGRGVAVRRELDALEREPRLRRRLERFSLVAETCKLNNSELKRFLEYAAECHAEDLQIEMRTRTLARKLTFRLPLCSPLLARLSLRDIGIANRWYKGAQPFRALEVIQLCEFHGDGRRRPEMGGGGRNLLDAATVEGDERARAPAAPVEDRRRRRNIAWGRSRGGGGAASCSGEKRN
jgi:hypothetical protein